jgi:isoleucyl-tRNA synthetase
MHREPDLIDVWFDSGAMPYAQWHYPFEHKDDFNTLYPADFIAEGVDQTRGWFFTLHALAVMLFDSVAYKNIVSNGLVLDKNGNKMSKRLGNGVDPFEVIHKYGADVLRWYLMTNSQPWDNLKFDIEGLEEIKRKFFGTLYNTYSFFALYANVDNYTGHEKQVPFNKRPEIDQWIISLLNSLIESVHKSYSEYEPTQAGRFIQDFVTEHLSNWYVRLNRKRFWGGNMDEDKLAAYQTLYECLLQVTKLMAPLAPFYAEKLYNDLHGNEWDNVESVHHAKFPEYNANIVDKKLEERMQSAQDVTSLVLSLRRKVNIKVRQPLSKILIPAINNQYIEQLQLVKDIILTEVNVKELEFIDANSEIIVKKVKPNFKLLGAKMGKHIKELANMLNELTQPQIQQIEKEGTYIFVSGEEKTEILLSELEILTQDMPGWLLASNGPLTVALDITLSEDLKNEGVARELVNRIQNIRKESGFEVTDKIYIHLLKNELVEKVINKHKAYISSQTLALDIKLFDKLEQNNIQIVEVDNNLEIQIQILKV